MRNKSYAYLLYFEPSNFLFLNFCKTEFDDITIKSNDQSGRPLEKED